MNEQTIALDVSKRPGAAPTVYLGQGDRSGTTLRCEVYDGGEALPLSGMAARLKVRRPGGGGVYSCEGSVSGNVATFAVDEQRACPLAGATDVAYVELSSGGSRVSTGRFRVVALESAEGE